MLKLSYKEINIRNCSETAYLMGAYGGAYALNVALAAGSNALGYEMLKPSTNFEFSLTTAVYAGMIGTAIQWAFTFTQAALCSSSKYMDDINRMNGTQATWWGVCIKDRVDCLPSNISLFTTIYVLARPVVLSVTGSLMGGAIQGALSSVAATGHMAALGAAGAAVVNPLLFVGSSLFTDCCSENCVVPQITIAPSSKQWALSFFNSSKKKVLESSVTPVSSKEQTAKDKPAVLTLNVA